MSWQHIAPWTDCRSAWKPLLLAAQRSELFRYFGSLSQYSTSATATRSRLWSQQEIQNGLAQWEAGDALQTIADRLGRSPRAVSSKLSRTRLDRGNEPDACKTRDSWTQHDSAIALAQRRAAGSRKGRIHFLPWSQQETNELVAQASAGRSQEAMARSLGRSVGAVSGKLVRLRSKTHPQLRTDLRRYTPEDDQQIIEMWSRGCSRSEISAGLSRKRSTDSIASRLQALGVSSRVSAKRREMHGHPRTEPERETLRRYLVDENLNWTEICALMPGRTKGALKQLAREHGIRRLEARDAPWSAEELIKLSKRMAKDPSRIPSQKEVERSFPGRTRRAVLARWQKNASAKQSGIAIPLKSPVWTVEEDNLIRDLDAKGPVRDIPGHLKHRGAEAVRQRVYFLRRRGLCR
jgi:DNA-binding CsgD family transcriptional regulator